jgi:hypothetical protein
MVLQLRPAGPALFLCWAQNQRAVARPVALALAALVTGPCECSCFHSIASALVDVGPFEEAARGEGDFYGFRVLAASGRPYRVARPGALAASANVPAARVSGLALEAHCAVLDAGGPEFSRVLNFG